MKIAFMVGTFPSLSETFILNQITGLIDRGCEVDIYANNRGDEKVKHNDIEKYHLMERTVCFYGNDSYFSIPENKAHRSLKAAVLFFLNIARNPVALFKSLNISKYGKSAASLRLFYMTVIFLNAHEYDMVYCHFGPRGIVGAMLKDIGAIKGKIVTVFHGVDMSRYIQKKGNDVYKMLFEKGDLFLPISERWKRELIRLGCNRKKIIVHRMGVDVDKFQYTPRVMNNNGRINILSVARLVEKKGIKYGVLAVARLIERYPNIEYTIAGDGPLKEDLEGLVRELGINGNVKLLGRKTQDEIVELMKSAHMLLAPSVTSEDGDQEGIPVVLMEAMAQGLPIISTFHSGIPELVIDGKSGCLVPERDVDALTEKLGYLIECSDKWVEMGQVGRKHIGEYFDIKELNERLVEINQKLTEGVPINL